MEINLPSRLITDSSVLMAGSLEKRMGQRCFKKRWTSYWQMSRGPCPCLFTRWSQNFATSYEHIDHVQQVLTLLYYVGMRLKMTNFEFFISFIDYLRLVIFPGRLEVSTRKIDAIRALEQPTNVMELRPFLSLCNRFRRLCGKGYATSKLPRWNRWEKN